MLTSAMCISSMTRFMTSTGHGEPAMMPVRSDERSKPPNAGCSSIAMNIVGTPYSDVHRSWATASSVASASKAGPGITMQAPWLVAPRLPMTMPKQW
jgi:hypothetical protein